MKKAASANPLGNNSQVCSFCAAFSSLSSGFLAHEGVMQRHFGSQFQKILKHLNNQYLYFNKRWN